MVITSSKYSFYKIQNYSSNLFWLFKKLFLTSSRILLAEVRYGLSGRDADMIKAFTYACSWPIGISQILSQSQGWSNGRCLRYDFFFGDCVSNLQMTYHTAWGFGVARSTLMGNARASIGGTGNSTGFHAFFINLSVRLWEAYRTWWTYHERKQKRRTAVATSVLQKSGKDRSADSWRNRTFSDTANQQRVKRF